MAIIDCEYLSGFLATIVFFISTFFFPAQHGYKTNVHGLNIKAIF